MKTWSVLVKSMREQRRDLWVLILLLTLAPFFVFLYWLFFGGGSTTYAVLAMNQDRGARLADGTLHNSGADVLVALDGIRYASGEPMLRVEQTADRAEAEQRLTDRDAEMLLIIPPDFSQTVLADQASGEALIVVGDLTNPYYAVASLLVDAALEGYLQAARGEPEPVRVVEEALGDSGARTEFEVYVPGLLVFAVIMLLFPCAMSVTREIEHGTLRRLQLTRMTAFDLLAGISITQVLIGMVAVLLAFGTAVALGFESQGPLWVAILVSAVTSLSTVGIGLLVACFSRSATQASIIANFPLMLLMFFSGSIFPIPRVPLFNLGAHTVGLYDILPPTHAVVALNKVLTLGAGLGEIAYELTAVLLLSVLYFAGGVWLFRRKHLRRQA